MITNKKIFLCIFFFLLSVIIIAPLSSQSKVRTEQSSDLVAHVGAIVQAKMALDEGQFPPKIGPYFQNNFGNPIFQFYAPVYFTIAGCLHKFLFPDNPYSALKFLLCLSLFFAGIFFYKLIHLLTNSEHIAFLSAFVYLTNPYLLANIYGIAHIPEIIAQCVLPAVLYYNMGIYFFSKYDIPNMIFAAMSWFAVLCIHPITFVYLSIFLSLLLIIITIFEKEKLKNLIYIGAAYIYGILLSSFYFFPVLIFTKYLLIGEHNVFIYPPYVTFFTPLSTLLSISPTAQMPLPGNGWLTAETRFYLSIGLPIIVGILGMIFILFKNYQFPNKKIKIYSVSLLCMSVIIFIATWTPFYFWNFLPKIFQIGQFTYRFLVQMAWVGTILFAMTIFVFAKKQLNIKQTIFGFMLIFLCMEPWLKPKPTSNHISVQSIIAHPEVPAAVDNYLMLSSKISTLIKDINLPVSRTQNDCTHVQKSTVCQISLPFDVNNVVQLPIFYYPDMLNVKVNGQKVSYFATQYDKFALVGLKLPRGTYTIESYFQGLVWANWLSTFMWMVTIIALCYFIFIDNFLSRRRSL